MRLPVMVYLALGESGGGAGGSANSIGFIVSSGDVVSRGFGGSAAFIAT